MNPYQMYQQQSVSGWTRIDLLLAIYEAALTALDQADAALRQGDAAAAQPLLARAQLLVASLTAGVNPEAGEVPRNLQRLYDFVLQRLRLGDVASALRVLKPLYDGLQQVRPAALQQERSGQLPPLDTPRTLQLTA